MTAEPEISAVDLTSGDRFLLLASDGVWGVLTCQAAVDIVAGCSTPEQGAQQVGAGLASPASAVPAVEAMLWSDLARKACFPGPSGSLLSEVVLLMAHLRAARRRGSTKVVDRGEGLLRRYIGGGCFLLRALTELHSLAAKRCAASLATDRVALLPSACPACIWFQPGCLFSHISCIWLPAKLSSSTLRARSNPV